MRRHPGNIYVITCYIIYALITHKPCVKKFILNIPKILLFVYILLYHITTYTAYT